MKPHLLWAVSGAALALALACASPFGRTTPRETYPCDNGAAVVVVDVETYISSMAFGTAVRSTSVQLLDQGAPVAVTLEEGWPPLWMPERARPPWRVEGGLSNMPIDQFYLDPREVPADVAERVEACIFEKREAWTTSINPLGRPRPVAVYHSDMQALTPTFYASEDEFLSIFAEESGRGIIALYAAEHGMGPRMVEFAGEVGLDTEGRRRLVLRTDANPVVDPARFVDEEGRTMEARFGLPIERLSSEELRQILP